MWLAVSKRIEGVGCLAEELAPVSHALALVVFPGVFWPGARSQLQGKEKGRFLRGLQERCQFSLGCDTVGGI